MKVKQWVVINNNTGDGSYTSIWDDRVLFVTDTNKFFISTSAYGFKYEYMEIRKYNTRHYTYGKKGKNMYYHRCDRVERVEDITKYLHYLI